MLYFRHPPYFFFWLRPCLKQTSYHMRQTHTSWGMCLTITYKILHKLAEPKGTIMETTPSWNHKTGGPTRINRSDGLRNVTMCKRTSTTKAFYSALCTRNHLSPSTNSLGAIVLVRVAAQRLISSKWLLIERVHRVVV